LVELPQSASATVRNPFVEISPGWRAAFLSYLLLVELMPAVVSPLVHGTADSYPLARIIVKLLSCALLALPFVCRRFGGVQMGWFHPIAFGTALITAVGLVRYPQSLLLPLTVWVQPIENWQFHPVVLGFAEEAVYGIALKGELLKLLALAASYAGFACFRWVPGSAFHLSLLRDAKPLLAVAAIAGLGIAAYIIQSSGGITAHMASFALGRFTSVGDIGHLAAGVAFAPAALVVVYLLQPSVLRKPWFLLLFLATCVIQFAVNGSRAALVLPVVLLAAAWVFHNRRIPAGTLGVLAAVLWLTIGVLGELRTSTWKGEAGMEFGSLLEFDLAESVEATNEQMTERVLGDMYLPTVGLVPEKVPYLAGDSYIGVLGAFIPRALWPSKPRGVDAFAGALIFDGRDSAEGYTGAGMPPGAVAESYWNFGVPGVFLVFFIFGALRKMLANLYLACCDSPPAAAMFILAIFFFSTPGGPDVIRFIRTIFFLGMIYLACGLRFERVAR
jgi:hypothetical protein